MNHMIELIQMLQVLLVSGGEDNWPDYNDLSSTEVSLQNLQLTIKYKPSHVPNSVNI